MFTRREVITAAGLAGLAGPTLAADDLIKPARLRRGDTVALVSPATAAAETQPIEIMQEALETFGFEVLLGENFYARRGYFAGDDAARAADINGFFANPDVRMIFARGGWGSARVLPLLDYELIRNNPKVLLGYSDATALLTAVHQRTGLVTFHGPSPLDSFSADYFQRIIVDGRAVSMDNPVGVDEDRLVQTEHRLQTIRGGNARGHILGGNLTVLTAIMGSDYLPSFDGAILFLEDIGEAVYRVDRMLTQLALAGVLGDIAGFVFGRCTDCGPGPGYGSLTLEQVLADHIEPLGIPAFSGSMIGHIDQQFTIPLGIDVEIDADRGSIRMLEPGVT